MINAILGTLRTGAPWRDLPDRYGPWETAHEWLSVVGSRPAPGSAPSIGWSSRRMRSAGWRGSSASAPASSVAHHHAAGARRRRGMRRRDRGPRRQRERARPVRVARPGPGPGRWR
ncbi:transposase [Streptoalloteichus tenebrarius]|uniref:transposase n=1 Tax=Streptoalloteichus tenebrarius (strain ATCC 17920 / DSM 40477 / JCM 4838 / CBS 697.72 / NBRC 16177 / NCIMB 11028 / NRRL B-12390 / A12253. 1 / ISP 5477) TaxID=1933 RepID=UPI003558DBBA